MSHPPQDPFLAVRWGAGVVGTTDISHPPQDPFLAVRWGAGVVGDH